MYVTMILVRTFVKKDFRTALEFFQIRAEYPLIHGRSLEATLAGPGIALSPPVGRVAGAKGGEHVFENRLDAAAVHRDVDNCPGLPICVPS